MRRVVWRRRWACRRFTAASRRTCASGDPAADAAAGAALAFGGGADAFPDGGGPDGRFLRFFFLATGLPLPKDTDDTERLGARLITDVVLSWRLRALAYAVSTSLLLFVAGEPIGFAPAAWVAFVPLLRVLFREWRTRWAAVYGLVAGLAYFGAHLSWIFLFGWMAWTALTLVMALYWTAAAAVIQLGRRLPLAPVLAAGAFTAFELVRDRWPFGGFPWGAVGTTQASMPGVRWMAGSIGAYGLTFLCVFAAALVADRLVTRSWAWGSIALVSAGTLLFAGVDAVRYAPDEPGRPVDVALVQGNVPRPVRFDQRVRILRSHAELTRAADPSADVVVWPEDAIGIGAPDGSLEAVAELARARGVHMLVGRSLADDDSATFTNSVVHLTDTGRVAATYTKQHPVPFGEYVPLSFLRGAVTTLEQVPYDLVRGDAPVVFDVDGTKIATPICFESVFPRDPRAFARLGAELQVFVTNDASFEGSFASEQHLAHARLRSLELRQWTAQAALSGITAVVAPDGRVSKATGLFEPALVEAQMRARRASSLYARVGDLYALGWVAGTGFAFVLWWIVRRPSLRRRTGPVAEEPASGSRASLR